MRGDVSSGKEKPTLLELVLQVHGEFRRRLDPLRVTPLQAGVLLYLQRHREANMSDTAAALSVRGPTLTAVVNDLVEQRWVTRRDSVEDRRVVRLSLSRQGKALARRIKDHVHDVKSDLTPRKET